MLGNVETTATLGHLFYLTQNLRNKNKKQTLFVQQTELRNTEQYEGRVISYISYQSWLKG